MAGKGPDIDYDSIPHIFAIISRRKAYFVKFLLFCSTVLLKLPLPSKLIQILCLFTKTFVLFKPNCDLSQKFQFHLSKASLCC